MKKTFKILILGIISLLLISVLNFVNAATGSFSVSAATSTLVKGKTTTVTVTAKNCAGQFTISSSDTSVATISSSSIWLDSSSSKITITAKGAGTATITIKATDVADTDANVVSGSKTVTIKVTDSSNSNSNTNNTTSDTSKTKSTNANLSTLGVTPKEYDFSGFSKDKTSYSVTVPNDVDSLKVAYKTADSKAKVKVTGNTNLEVGTNEIKVVVTAEDGKTTKTYTIKVTKLATEDNKPGNIIDDEKNMDLYLTSLSIEGLELTPEFSSNVFSYEATINMDENDMSEVKVNAQANDEKATVEVTGNTGLVEGENLINIVVKTNDSSNQTVYQITINKVSQASEIVLSNNPLNTIKKEYLIIGGFVLIVLIIIIILIVQHIRNKEYYYYDDEEEIDNDIDNESLNNNEEIHDNFIEELYKRKNNGEELNKSEEETIEDIEKENDRIFNKPTKGETVEYTEINDTEQEDKDKMKSIEDLLNNKRKKGKHF